jgi:5'-AMP-activated protein kinase catalytic alpha subunit
MLKEDDLDINDFIFKEDIGEGNFGKVKFCIFKKTGEEFAIKIINKKKIKDKMKNSFFKENEIATKFNHINVIYVFRIFEDKENFYLVMEYCQKGELFDYIVQHQRLSEREAAIFFYQLINGVEYIHSKGIAHRDLKPENLLLTNDKTLKIIDFGLSHEFDPNSYLLKTKCGSPSYAAPEIISCQYYDGFKTDIWCCGIILYAMLCGFLPFEGDDNSILFRNILECDPEMPDWLSISSRDLIIKILNPEPDERITLDEIKRHKFYLKGKKLCKINYDDMNTYVKMRKLKIDRNKVIDDIIKMDNNNNINNNKEKSNEKINRKNNIKIKYCNTISGNKSKTKPFIKNLNMKNNNSINAIKKKIKNLKIKEKKPAENSKNKNIKINIQKPLLDQNNSSNKNYNLLKEYNHTECNSINPKNVSIKNKFTSLLSRLNSDKKPLFLKIINSTLDRNNNAEEKENEQKKCNIIINQLKENFRKLNNQKKLMNKNNYINITNSSSHIQLNKKNHKIKSFREQLKEVLYTNNNVTSPINSLSVKNRRIRINSSENRNRNKKRKINLINNLYEKPIVYFDNLSININNINVHQKAYNNSLNAKSKIYFDKKLIMKKNKNNDLDYKKRNNTINPKRPRYHLNFNDLVIKSDFNTKDCNEKGNNNIKIRKQIIIKKGKNFDKIN